MSHDCYFLSIGCVQLFLHPFFLVFLQQSYVLFFLLPQALAANIETMGHFQPMVAILCGHGKFHNQYLDENKKWISDPDLRATCSKDKLEILEYCRKVGTAAGRGLS